LLAITNLITVLNFLGLYDFVVILYILAISTSLAVLGFALIVYFLLFGLLIILNFVTALGCLLVLNSFGSIGFPHRIIRTDASTGLWLDGEAVGSGKSRSLENPLRYKGCVP
jgi:hypothetical protein